MRRALPLVGTLAFALGACGSDGLNNDGGGGASAGPGDAGASFAGNSVSCPPGPGYSESTEPQQVDEVSALLVDLDGDPVAEAPVQVCGTDICIIGESTASGGVVMAPMQAIRKPAFKVGDGKTSALVAWLLPDQPNVDLGTVPSVRLPALGEGEALVAGEAASSGGLTLLAAPGSGIRFDTLLFRTPEEKQLRALPIPLDAAPARVDSDLGFEMVYAATPSATEFCPPAVLSVENSVAWEPGTEAEVWLHGVDITEDWAPYGGWAKVSDARVSEDGLRIETTEPGLPVLGVLGFKRR